MSMAGSIFGSTASLNRFHGLNPSHTLMSLNPSIPNLAITNYKINGVRNLQGKRSFNYFGVARREPIRKSSVFGSLPLPGVPPLPSGSPPTSWNGWMVVIVMTFVLPFVTHKWGPLLLIKKQVDTVVETAEQIVDVVEMVSEKIDKVAEGIAHDLPEGGSLRHAIDFVEDVAETVAKDAHLAAQFIDKVEELEEKLEHSFMEPTIHHQDNEAAHEVATEEGKVIAS